MTSQFTDTRTAAVDGTTLAYRTRGSGEPVAFVHVEDLAALLRMPDAAPAHLVGNSSCARSSSTSRRDDALRQPHAAPARAAAARTRRSQTVAAIVRMGAGALGPAQRAFRRDDDEKGTHAFMAACSGASGFAGCPPRVAGRRARTSAS